MLVERKRSKDNSSKVLVVALDGATFDLLLSWAENGFLPNIKRLLDNGCYGKLRSSFPAVTAPAWASFLTGNSPGNTGIFDFFYKDSSGNYRCNNRTTIKSEILWTRLNRFGKKTGILFVPMTYPVDEIDGFMITGLMTPNYNSQNAMYPRDLLKKYKVNTSLLSKYVHSKTASRGYKKFLGIISKQLKEKGRLALELIEKEVWDFFMVHFFEIDTVSHCMWRFMDKNSPLFDIKGHKKYGDAIFKIYQQCDKIIGEMLEKIDSRSLNIILMSDHGFGQTLIRLNINNWLKDIGLLKFRDLTLDKIVSNLCNRISLKFTSLDKISLTLNTFVNSIYKLLPKLLRSTVDFLVIKAVNWLPSTMRESILPFYTSMIDWCNTKAYSLGTRGGIFINLEGQNNLGIVKKEEYEPLLSYILEEMRKVKSHDGNLIVKKVYKKHEVFHGEYLDWAPDLIPSEECDGFHFSYDFSERGFILDTLLNVNGSHRTDGVLIISGESIKRGKAIINAKIEDLTPTIYYLMGVRVPENLDGRILEELIIK